MKLKNILIALTIGVAVLAAPLANAIDQPEDTVRIEVFERDDCGHCQDEKEFLNDLQKERGDLIIVYHDIGEKFHKEHFLQLTELENIPKVTPITIIDSVILQGFDTAETTGKKMQALIDGAKGKVQYTFSEFIEIGGSGQIETGGATCDIEGEEIGCGIDTVDYMVTVPFVGPVNVAKYSLPVLSVILGFVDGFNPCAMWVLVLFLTILMEAGSRRRMFEMAGLFIFAEAVMYYLILNVWMTAWDFVGLDEIVTPIVGLVAVGAGSYFLYLFYKEDTSCKVGSLESKRKTSEKIKHYATAPMTIITAVGILGLAFSVNIIEFACSVGIPQTFTKVLDINYLSWAGKQIYNAIYIFMYMVDDLIIFALALYSFDRIGLTTHKYTRASHLIGGALMVVLGLILLFDPTLLVFG
ncbi:glutaredoxin [Patescibacteria group bacterium]|nr:glutaredoxin [Patescibacteria group bacterium]MBU1935237.1 glutaredoxin [Patescibacteria group bacterium]